MLHSIFSNSNNQNHSDDLLKALFSDTYQGMRPCVRSSCGSRTTINKEIALVVNYMIFSILRSVVKIYTQFWRIMRTFE